MTNTTYQPGDRVRALNSMMMHTALCGRTATVVAKPSELTADFDHPMTYFVFDADPLKPTSNGTRFWRTAEISAMFERQPVEAGCWVRYNDTVPDALPECKGKTGKVIAMLHNDQTARIIWDGVSYFMDHTAIFVARVVAPEPKRIASANSGGILFEAFDNGTFRSTVLGGVDLASGPDFTGFHIQSFGRAERPDTLKQAQALAKTLDAKHFDGNIQLADTLPGVLDQIDHMTAHMVKAPAAPTFKRGDLVTWGAGQIHGRIVGPAPSKHAPWEVIITAVPGNNDSKQLGTFTTPDLDSLRHSTKRRPGISIFDWSE